MKCKERVISDAMMLCRAACAPGVSLSTRPTGRRLNFTKASFPYHRIVLTTTWHPPGMTRDTAHWRPFLRMGRFSKRLRHLARDHCGLKIQGGAHDPAEDARAAMYLYLKFKDNWEGQVHATRQGRDGRGRIYHY